MYRRCDANIRPVSIFMRYMKYGASATEALTMRQLAVDGRWWQTEADGDRWRKTGMEMEIGLHIFEYRRVISDHYNKLHK
jgi:hypothetical protein